MISHSTDWGAGWSEPQVITGDSAAYEDGPFLLCGFIGNDSLIHCFYDVAGTYADIYYVRNKPFFATHMPMPDNEHIFLDIKSAPSVFNSTTLLTFTNSEGGDVEAEIFNILGQMIWHKSINGKEGNIVWDARDMDGRSISSGTYIVRATTGKSICNTKLLYLK